MMIASLFSDDEQKLVLMPAGLLRKTVQVVMGLHIIVAIYLLTYHQGGTEQAYATILQDLQSHPNTSNGVQIIVLAPCYTFPGYSYLTGRDLSSTNITLFAPHCAYPW